MNLERAKLVIAGREDSLNGMFSFATGEILAVCDVLTGELVRCFDRPHKSGHVIRSSNIFADDGAYGLPCFSRIVSIAPASMIADYRRRLKKTAPGYPFKKGHWHRVIED